MSQTGTPPRVADPPMHGRNAGRSARLRVGATCAAWSVATLALALGGAATCAEGGCAMRVIDDAVLAGAHALAVPWLDGVAAIVTWLGSIAVLLPAALVLAWRYRQRGFVAAAVLLPTAVVGAALFARLAKALFDRPRPDLFPALAAMPADASFPSAHAMQIGAFALAWALAPGVRRGKLALAGAALLVLAVAASRVHLQVHYPSDVVVGVIAAAGWVLGLRWLLDAASAPAAEPPPRDRHRRRAMRAP